MAFSRISSRRRSQRRATEGGSALAALEVFMGTSQETDGRVRPVPFYARRMCQCQGISELESSGKRDKMDRGGFDCAGNFGAEWGPRGARITYNSPKSPDPRLRGRGFSFWRLAMNLLQRLRQTFEP